MVDSVTRELLDLNDEQTVREAIVRQLKQTALQMGKSFTFFHKETYEVIFLPATGPLRVLKEIDRALEEGKGSLWKVPFRIVRKKGGVIVGAMVVN